MKPNIVGLCCAMALLCLPTAVRADPVAITSGGWLNATFQDGGVMELVSDHFDVGAAWDCCAFGWAQQLRLGSGWTPGSVQDMTTTTTAQRGTFGTGTVDGTPYRGRSASDLLSFGGTTLQFAAPPFTVPGPAPVGTTMNFTLPFTMNGSLLLTSFSSGPVLADSITGAGDVSFSLRSTAPPSGPQWAFDAPTNFVFASSPSPTPEPTSLVLLATGIVGVLGRRHWRRAR